MICSVFAVLFSSTFANSKCLGNCKIIGDLSENVDLLLKDKKCLELSESGNTLKSLVINRLTPHMSKDEFISKLDVCEKHLVRFITLFF